MPHGAPRGHPSGPLRNPRPSGRRWDGAGVPGPGHQAGPPRGDQGAVGHDRHRSAFPFAFRAGGQGRRGPRPPKHPLDPRLRMHRRRHVHRHGAARRRKPPGRPPCRPAAAPPRPRRRHADRRGARGRPRKGVRPPRPQARERLPDPDGSREAAGLRPRAPRAPPDPARGRRIADPRQDHDGRRARRDPRLHVARAGEGAGRRLPVGPVLARGSPLRDARLPPSVQGLVSRRDARLDHPRFSGAARRRRSRHAGTARLDRRALPREGSAGPLRVHRGSREAAPRLPGAPLPRGRSAEDHERRGAPRVRAARRRSRPVGARPVPGDVPVAPHGDARRGRARRGRRGARLDGRASGARAAARHGGRTAPGSPLDLEPHPLDGALGRRQDARVRPRAGRPERPLREPGRRWRRDPPHGRRRPRGRAGVLARRRARPVHAVPRERHGARGLRRARARGARDERPRRCDPGRLVSGRRRSRLRDVAPAGAPEARRLARRRLEHEGAPRGRREGPVLRASRLVSGRRFPRGCAKRRGRRERAVDRPRLRRGLPPPLDGPPGHLQQVPGLHRGRFGDRPRLEPGRGDEPLVPAGGRTPPDPPHERRGPRLLAQRLGDRRDRLPERARAQRPVGVRLRLRNAPPGRLALVPALGARVLAGRPRRRLQPGRRGRFLAHLDLAGAAGASRCG